MKLTKCTSHWNHPYEQIMLNFVGLSPEICILYNLSINMMLVCIFVENLFIFQVHLDLAGYDYYYLFVDPDFGEGNNNQDVGLSVLD